MPPRAVFTRSHILADLPRMRVQELGVDVDGKVLVPVRRTPEGPAPLNAASISSLDVDLLRMPSDMALCDVLTTSSPVDLLIADDWHACAYRSIQDIPDVELSDGSC